MGVISNISFQIWGAASARVYPVLRNCSFRRISIGAHFESHGGQVHVHALAVGFLKQISKWFFISKTQKCDHVTGVVVGGAFIAQVNAVKARNCLYGLQNFTVSGFPSMVLELFGDHAFPRWAQSGAVPRPDGPTSSPPVLWRTREWGCGVDVPFADLPRAARLRQQCLGSARRSHCAAPDITRPGDPGQRPPREGGGCPTTPTALPVSGHTT